MVKKHNQEENTSSWSRRQVLGALAVAGFIPLVGCDGGSTTSENTTPDAGGESAVADAAPTESAPTETAATENTPTETVAADSWATGGTKAMTAKSSYPNPFTAAPTACLLMATTTEGPCTTSTDLDREDISDGLSGLPVRLALRVVDTSCNPLAGAVVKIWHTNTEGSYSGQTPNNNMCLKDQSYSSTDFFRGVQTTSAEGIAYFDTCFPGWYRGRAVHIHFQIKQGGTSTRISQLFFPEETTKEIFDSHSEYKSYGQPDTVFSNDNIMAGIPSGERDRHIFTVARMEDGAMLASQTIAVS